MTPKRRYIEHRANARARGIEFLLTFEEWITIWLESGKWDQRGSFKGQYVMARFGDIGPYAVGNVRICVVMENFSEADHRVFGERNGAYGRNFWAEATPEEREQRSAKMSARSKGRPKAPEMKEALSKTVTGRKKVIRDGRSTWAYPSDADYPRE